MSEPANVSDKSRQLIKGLVELYIAEGQPVGSKRLADASELNVSPATIRNMMADLEEKGFLTSPHTSAGRVPTDKAYRLFVDSLIQVEPLDTIDLKHLSRQLDPDMSSKQLVESASGMLSEVTRLVGLVTLPRREQVVLRHVEFLPLNDNRVLVILVLDDHEVQNRIIYTQEEYTEAQLREAANFINQSFMGQSLGGIRNRLISSMKTDRDAMNSLMARTLEVAEKAFEPEEAASDYVLAGQEHLFDHYEPEMLADLRELFRAFALKGDILHLLDRCMDTQGVQLFIGQESGNELLDDCSLITSPYGVDGQLVGVLGVVGPTRMPYDRIIPVVDATARILSSALESTRPRQG